MKIIYQSRTTLFSVPGGDTVQILKTCEFMKKMGVTVSISTELSPDVSGYDIVHLFNLMRPQEAFLQVCNAKRYDKPVALSTIYGLYTEFEKKARKGIAGFITRILKPYQIEYLKILARAVFNRELNRGTLLLLRYGYYSLQKRLCAMTDVFLPNSYSEMERVKRDMELNKYRSTIVPNAVDTVIFNPESLKADSTVSQFKGCVLCVARIEGRKSQLELIRAMKSLPFQLVLIGQPGPNSFRYFEQCRRESGKNVTFLGQIEHSRLPQYYLCAKVHALISWMETPGLSSLEAAAMGCNLVITEKGDTREYFGDMAYYCEPDNVDSIREAIVRAYEAPPNPLLQERVRKFYNWEKAAQATLAGYRLALERK